MPAALESEPLGLVDDEDDPQEEPRRFLRLPRCGTILAYGGEDGQISGKLANEKSKFKVMHRYNDMVRAVAISNDGKRIAVGFDDGSTTIYSFDDSSTTAPGEDALHAFCATLRKGNKGGHNDDDVLEDFVDRTDFTSFAGPQFELPIRDMTFLSNDRENDLQYQLAIANESGLVLVNVTSAETLTQRKLEYQIQEHHNYSGIRGVATTKNLLATLAMDGRLCVWDTINETLLEREAFTCIPKKDVGEIHGADPYDRACRPVFYSNEGSTVLATPGQLLPKLRQANSTLTKFESVELENTIPDQGHVEPIVCIHFLDSSSNKGKEYLLLSSGRDSRLVLWKWDGANKVTPLKTFFLSSVATDLMVPPKGSSKVYAACAKGTYTVVDLTPHLPGQSVNDFLLPTTGRQSAATSRAPPSTNDEAQSKTENKKIVKHAKKRGTNGDDSDEDSEVDFGGTHSEETAATISRNRVRFVDDEAEDTDSEEKPGLVEAPVNDLPKDDDDDSLDDMRPSHTTLEELDDALDDLDHAPPSFAPPVPRGVPPQPAFAPSSTPLDLPRRFLCWNHSGAITLLQGDHLNTVDISFADSAYKRPVSFTDNMNFIVASLGEDGALFATDLTREEDHDDEDGLDDLNMSETTKRAVRKSQKKGGTSNGSSIFFYRFETFGSLQDKDWYVTLPDGELVLGTATGIGWAAVMTSRKFLRFFSNGGNQAQVVWLKGDPVTMAGRGRFLAVIYHESPPLADGTQQLAYTIWDAANFEILSKGPVSCLGKGASLTWIGFSNDFTLMAMDSEGMLSMLVQAGSQGSLEWVPVLDTMGLRKSKEDNFWPVTVYDGKLVCVPLKGGNTYPDAVRKPITSTLGLRLPLAASGAAKVAALEELNIRSNLALAQKKFLHELEGADEEELEQEFLSMSAQVDKVTLKLFAAMVDANKLERALDLVDRLHLEKSYDLAIRISDRHSRLADLIQDAKDLKFPSEFQDGSSEFDYKAETTPMGMPGPMVQVSPEGNNFSRSKRGVGKVGGELHIENKRTRFGE